MNRNGWSCGHPFFISRNMKIVIPLELVELEEKSYHMAMVAQFPQGEELTWLIDTGASRSVFDQSLTSCYEPLSHDEGSPVQSAGIGSTSFDASLALLREFSLGEVTLPPMKVALIDLSHINELYFHAVGIKICGLIGSDFLLEYRALIDYGRRQITLHSQRRAGFCNSREAEK